ncbi:hypothetical protein ACQKMY_10555 [Peribacillus frigoritolerans]|uniref:hypothetical protein n=1 Tax=Peribacillus frigoritolerans TaxID=450367 RepID=UPI003D010BD7
MAVKKEWPLVLWNMVYLEIRCESSHEFSQLKIVIKWGRLKRLKTRKCRWPQYELTANRQAAG